jgi:hypothetical protein
MPENWQSQWPPTRIAALARVDAARYLDPNESVRLALFPRGHESLVPATIIEVGGVFLVESIDNLGNWYMGVRGPDGVIECWGDYGDIEDALGAL